MRFQALFFLLLLTCMYLSLAQGSYDNCCLATVKNLKPRARRNIVSCRIQETDGDCNIRAAVFVIKKRASESKPRTICVDPEKKWVKDVCSTLQARMDAQN